MGGSFSNLLRVSFQGIRVLEKCLGHWWHITLHQSETSKQDLKNQANQAKSTPNPPKSIPNPPQIDRRTTPNRSKNRFRRPQDPPRAAKSTPTATQEQPNDQSSAEEETEWLQDAILSKKQYIFLVRQHDSGAYVGGLG